MYQVYICVPQKNSTWEKLHSIYKYYICMGHFILYRIKKNNLCKFEESKEFWKKKNHSFSHDLIHTYHGWYFESFTSDKKQFLLSHDLEVFQKMACWFIIIAIMGFFFLVSMKLYFISYVYYLCNLSSKFFPLYG